MDLNIVIHKNSTGNTFSGINEKLARCKELGFHTVALSVYATHDTIPPAPKLNELSIPNGLKVLTRLTAIVSSSDEVYKFSKSKLRLEYDLLAFEPQNTKILQHLASSSPNFEILTFNLTERLDYSIFKISLQKLKQQGVCVELNYASTQINSFRRNIIANAQGLTEKSSRNIILSNGIDDIFRLRGPKDAQFIGVLFLMSMNKCHDAVFNNGLNAINLAKHRGNQASSAIVHVKSE